MNCRTSGVQFSAERIAITKLAMIRFGVSVGGCANVLKFGLGQGRFVCWQRSGASCAARREKDCEERRENGESEAAKFGVGQGRSPGSY